MGMHLIKAFECSICGLGPKKLYLTFLTLKLEVGGGGIIE